MRTAKSGFGLVVGLTLLLSTLSSVTPAQRPAGAGQAGNAARLILTEGTCSQPQIGTTRSPNWPTWGPRPPT